MRWMFVALLWAVAMLAGAVAGAVVRFASHGHVGDALVYAALCVVVGSLTVAFARFVTTEDWSL